MSGHSKWANIRLRKGAQDVKKAKLFGKLAREIIIASKEGGGSPDINSRLRTAIQKAREGGMPQDNIKRAVQRGTGEIEGAALEEVTYEGYGPAGVALLIHCLTENRNRTVGEVRSILNRHGGNLGATGSASYLFENKGMILISKGKTEEDTVMEIALENGALDVITEGDCYEIITSPQEVEAMKAALEAKKITPDSAEATLLPTNKIPLEGHDAQRVLKLVDLLEDLDDVQQVYANFDISDEVLEAAMAD
jgi:YebC/PmpR family DNA-binding regulatory protein